jgi:hypothetical protein
MIKVLSTGEFQATDGSVRARFDSKPAAVLWLYGTIGFDIAYPHLRGNYPNCAPISKKGGSR